MTSDRRVQREVEELLWSYARAVDERRLQDAGELLTEDCVLELVGAYRDEGRQAIRERQEQRIAANPDARSRHLVTNIRPQGSGAELSVRSDFAYLESSEAGVVAKAVGRYEDLVVATEDGWCIAERRMHVDLA